MKKHTEHLLSGNLKRSLGLLLVVHFLFVFCAADLFHTDDCPSQSGNPFGTEDGCPVCTFQRGLHAEQPVFCVSLGSALAIAEQVIVWGGQVQSVKPALHLCLRAPPAVS